MFLECAVEVRICGVPSTIDVDGVAGGKGASKLDRVLISGGRWTMGWERLSRIRVQRWVDCSDG